MAKPNARVIAAASWPAVRPRRDDLISPCNTCGVRDIAACATLDADDQKRLVAIMTTVAVEAQRPVFSEAADADYVYNLTSGAVKIYKLLSDGRRQITGFLFAGDFLGLIQNASHVYTAETLVPTTLCRFPRHKLERLLAELPRLEQRLLGLAAHELVAAQDHMMLLGRKRARERLASFLLMLSDGAARRGMSANPVPVPMSRSDIGDYLGLTIETVSRTLTQLRGQGLIEMLDDRLIRLVKPEALRKIAAGR